jgi:hypothetical protein
MAVMTWTDGRTDAIDESKQLAFRGVGQRLVQTYSLECLEICRSDLAKCGYSLQKEQKRKRLKRATIEEVMTEWRRKRGRRDSNMDRDASLVFLRAPCCCACLSPHGTRMNRDRGQMNLPFPSRTP